jgi:hypothetical protein
MRSLGMLQIAGGVVAAGVVAAGATAMTGTGVSWLNTGTGKAAQYVGGTLTQTVSGGATIDSIAYTTTSSGTNGAVNDRVTVITVGLTGANGAYLTVTPSNSSGGFGASGADEWICTGDTATTTTNKSATVPKVLLNASPASIVCATGESTNHTTTGYYTGLTGVALAVTNS